LRRRHFTGETTKRILRNGRAADRNAPADSLDIEKNYWTKPSAKLTTWRAAIREGRDFFPPPSTHRSPTARNFWAAAKILNSIAAGRTRKKAIIGAIDYRNQTIEASAKVRKENRPKKLKKRKERK